MDVVLFQFMPRIFSGQQTETQISPSPVAQILYKLQKPTEPKWALNAWYIFFLLCHAHNHILGNIIYLVAHIGNSSVWLSGFCMHICWSITSLVLYCSGRDRLSSMYCCQIVHWECRLKMRISSAYFTAVDELSGGEQLFVSFRYSSVYARIRRSQYGHNYRGILNCWSEWANIGCLWV